MEKSRGSTIGFLSPTIAFILVSLSLGQLGDGLNIFQGIYLVGLGWNEGSVGTALSLMGLTALIIQTWAGDLVDKTTIDRRYFLTTAAIVTAISASTILLVHEGNQDHALIFISKIVEGVASSFIGPCLAALTLATFGPHHFDAIMASNIFWGHIGSVVAAVLAGGVSYALYPNIKYCFLVISASALVAVLFVQHLPEGDPQMGRGFQGKVALDEQGHVERLQKENSEEDVEGSSATPSKNKREEAPTASTYLEVFSDRRSLVICLTGFFFHFANANVLLVLGELMGGDEEDGGVSKTAIPLIAGAIVCAQVTMAIATIAGDKMTHAGIGRKPLLMAGLLTLPIRCALVIYWKDSGDAFLLSTQILDGLGGGFIGLVHPYIVADITFGTGRFNVLMGLTASSFGLGATMSNYLGQMAVEKFGHVVSLMGSLIISTIPILIFGCFMPESLGARGTKKDDTKSETAQTGDYVEMS